MKKSISLLIVFLIIISMLSVSVSAADKMTIYVSADASPGGDGSTASPLSLFEAVDSLESSDSEREIILGEGTYYIPDMLRFDGIGGGKITFRSEDGKTARISGAHSFGGWKETELNGVRAFEADTKGEKITALFRNGEKLNTARMPEEGFFYVYETNDEDNLWTEETTPNIQILGSHSFFGNRKDITSVPSNLDDISIYIVHMWQEELSGVTSIDPKTGKICLKKYASHTIEVDDRYFFENVKEAADKPGEWCIDSAEGKIYYIPFENEAAENIELFVSSVTKLTNFANCENISFEGIIFENTGWEYASKEYLNINDFLSGYGVDIDVSQAGIDVCGAITANQSDNISFSNCEFLNIGCTAIKLLDGCDGCSVENCYFDNIGASGVFVGGKNDEENCASDFTLKNSIIGNYGQKFYRAPGVILTYCNGADISNNEIHDGNYTGISCGWVWLYGKHITQNINIENNLIYNIGLGMLSDMGGIYMLGVQPGSEIHGNVIHDVKCYSGIGGYAGTGLYTDAGSSEMTLHHNLVFNCSTSGFNATIGRNNVWYNNIAAFCGERLVNPPQNYMDFVSGAEYRNNIFLTDNGVPIYSSIAISELLNEHDNILWDLGGDRIYFTYTMADDGSTLKKSIRDGFLSGTSTVADPLFKDAEHYDFTLQDNSPAFESGFTAWDYDQAGTKSGTVIGIGRQGGKTAYNDNVSQCELMPVRLNFDMRLSIFFEDLWSRIIRFFKTIFGVI